MVHRVQRDARVARKIDQRCGKERESENKANRDTVLVREIETCAHECHDTSMDVMIALIVENIWP